MRTTALLVSIAAAFTVTSAFAQPAVQGEVELKAASRLERSAGVWLDGQYVGVVSELDGRGGLVLLPGEHELTFKLIGYEDVTSRIVVEPGQQQKYQIAMKGKADAVYPDEANTAQLRVDVKPEDAAVFINEAFVGRTDRFGARQGMRLSPGEYRVTIALPGYESFEAALTLRAGQTYEIKTELAKGSVEDQAQELSPGAPAAREP